MHPIKKDMGRYVRKGLRNSVRLRKSENTTGIKEGAIKVGARLRFVVKVCYLTHSLPDCHCR